MVRKKLDGRIRTVIENAVGALQRSMFVIVGDKAKDQVVILHHMLSKATFKARPSVLWCYKKELGFSTHRKKRMRQMQKRLKQGNTALDEDNPFELFVASTQIRYCYYSETEKILGNTYGCCVLQDFEALTPNLLARTIETVEGGGIVFILLKSVQSLKQLYSMTMDVHFRYRTESQQDVVGRFNERFILSLTSCKSCLVVDDQLNILPISSHNSNIKPIPPKNKDELTAEESKLAELVSQTSDMPVISKLVAKCKTFDQAQSVLKMLEVIFDKSLSATVSVTAARGRGKSAALGLAIGGAVGCGYSNIFVTSPTPENLRTLFEFVLKSFDVLDYEEHVDYEVVQSTNPEFNHAIVRLNITKQEHRQTVQYIHPSDAIKLGQCELLVIDEAAAIPMPLVKALLGPYLVFMASTINGYEGTGRSLSLKLVQQLRTQTAPPSGSGTEEKNWRKGMNKFDQLSKTVNKTNNVAVSTGGRSLVELTLDESIRYRPGDPVESWLNELLCLDASVGDRMQTGCPAPKDCELYYINRDTLFCYHKASETFLQRLMAIYVSAHYKNTPNDLQMLSDAPAHHLFCLLGPVKPDQSNLPEILCVLQVCMEGCIKRESVDAALNRGRRAPGDMIPWTVSQQFQDPEFASLAGIRVVRIATHPDYQSMGYGGRALQLLVDYFEGRIPCVNEMTGNDMQQEDATDVNDGDNLQSEDIAPKKNLPPLLSRLDERRAEKLDWLGVSFGLTEPLLKFWKRYEFCPVYLRQTCSDLTGEHSTIMLRCVNEEGVESDSIWLDEYYNDFKRRLISLLGYDFRNFIPSLPLSMLHRRNTHKEIKVLSREELSIYLSNRDLLRLSQYSKQLVDHHLITDLLPSIAKLYYTDKMKDVKISIVQSAIIMALGLQYKSVESVASELDLPVSQVLGLFQRTVRKFVEYFDSICEEHVDKRLFGDNPNEKVEAMKLKVKPAKISLQEDLEEAEVAGKHKEDDDDDLSKVTLLGDLEQYKICGTEQEWSSALDSSKAKTLLSIKSDKKSKKRSLLEVVIKESKPEKRKKKSL